MIKGELRRHNRGSAHSDVG